MLIRSVAELSGTKYEVEWGNGTSWRLLTAGDNMGFTVCHTVVRAGTSSLLEYRAHLEACYCLAGSGEIEDADGTVHRITPGVLYALDRHDRHHLRADPHTDLTLISVFNPPLHGTERHLLDRDEASSY
ncbi:ectoine synthase [Allostreptomyces psammosilenae]|uniref:L-ectoine synthase n=1 Tax=Allostreptomyces psammosilenae TaxID=1892865 RepID=A0A852ZMF7_9ACTN|nr:ectoine synthase [Allostreptomyces psammosilenae]NYI03606.1 L-ectoine synthase [Allostreptomyces psammosilenae]